MYGIYMEPSGHTDIMLTDNTEPVVPMFLSKTLCNVNRWTGIIHVVFSM